MHGDLVTGITAARAAVPVARKAYAAAHDTWRKVIKYTLKKQLLDAAMQIHKDDVVANREMGRRVDQLRDYSGIIFLLARPLP